MSTAIAPPQRRRRPLRRIVSPAQHINVGDTERLVSILGGAALGLFGLSRRSLGGLGLAAVGGSLLYRGMTGHCPGYQSLGVSSAQPVGSATSVRAGHGIKVEESITINRDAATLWRFWRKLENIGRFMQHLECVEEIDERRSRWTARGPLGVKLQWEAEIINEKENELIAWRSVDDSEVDTAGSVHFRELPHGRGTEMRVVLKYDLRYDAHTTELAEPIARLLGQSPSQQIREDLRRFKQVMETGETATIEGQPRGQCG
ncbi:MAG TPA: YgaP-like transmembrane domain [Gemmataceae bacterium]|nr:YgaP-like transmembrane domain [Gemmataceae bacterium]